MKRSIFSEILKEKHCFLFIVQEMLSFLLYPYLLIIVRDINVHHNLNWHLINIRNVWLKISIGLIGMCFSSSANACSLGCWLQLWMLNMEVYAILTAECLLLESLALSTLYTTIHPSRANPIIFFYILGQCKIKNLNCIQPWWLGGRVVDW